MGIKDQLGALFLRNGLCFLFYNRESQWEVRSFSSFHHILVGILLDLWDRSGVPGCLASSYAMGMDMTFGWVVTGRVLFYTKGPLYT